MSDVKNELLYEILKQIQSDVAEMKQAHSEMRAGFASVKGLLVSMQSDDLAL